MFFVCMFASPKFLGLPTDFDFSSSNLSHEHPSPPTWHNIFEQLRWRNAYTLKHVCITIRQYINKTTHDTYPISCNYFTPHRGKMEHILLPAIVTGISLKISTVKISPSPWKHLIVLVCAFIVTFSLQGDNSGTSLHLDFRSKKDGGARETYI